MFSLFSKASFGLLSSGSGVKSDYRDCGLKMTTESYIKRDGGRGGRLVVVGLGKKLTFLAIIIIVHVSGFSCSD